jgi:mono/diheme cytochrome c family protein
LKPFLAVLALFLCMLPAAAQSSPATSPSAANQVNPVKATPESLAQGKKYWGYDCAMCHGENGDGKGDVAVEEKLKLKDYRDPSALAGMSDAELFNIIKSGKGQMPPEGGRLKDAELWNLVNYVRSLARK